MGEDFFTINLILIGGEKMSIWIDCKLEKLHLLMPDISILCLLLNRWNFLASLDNEEKRIIYDYNYIERFEQKVANYYGYDRQLLTNWNLDFNSLPPIVLFPCDQYYLFYSKDFYRQNHCVHYVFLKNSNEIAYIYDDNPNYEGGIQQDCLLKGYLFIQNYEKIYIEYFNKKHIVTRTDEEVKLFVKREFMYDSFHLGDLITQLLDYRIQEVDVVEYLSTLLIPLKKLNALPLLAQYINECTERDFSTNVSSLQSYTNAWTILTNLANKCYLSDISKNWDRIHKRLEKIIEIEKEARAAMYDCINRW